MDLILFLLPALLVMGAYLLPPASPCLTKDC